MSYGKCGMKPRLTPPIIAMPDVTDSSGNVYADLGIPEPKHGEVKRNGDDTYVWDSGLKVWVQTRYAED
jgi:hypothetical protein